MLKKMLVFSYFPRVMLSLIIMVVVIHPVSAHAGAPIPNKDKMMTDLDIIKNTFEIKYAPAEWKRSFANWDLEEQVHLAKTKILERDPFTLKDFQHVLLEFFNATKDYHVGVHFYSTEVGFLPFRVQSVPIQTNQGQTSDQASERKYYIGWAYAPFFNHFFKEPLKKGDEVLLFNNEPIDSVVKRLQQLEFGNPDSQTDQALAEITLTMRLGEKGHQVPKGPVSLTIRRAGTTQIVTYEMEWLYQEEEISGSLSPIFVAEQAKLLSRNGQTDFASQKGKKRTLGAHPFFYKNMSTPFFQNYKQAIVKRKQLLLEKVPQEKSEYQEEEDDWDEFVGADKSFIPDLGKILWRPKADPYMDNPFHAYLYLSTGGKKIGYVRIPHYSGGEYSVGKFAEIIDYFQKNSAALVIDQVNNPGGSLFYMYTLASMLSDKPLVVPKQRETLTQENVLAALEIENALFEVSSDEEAVGMMGETIEGYPVDYPLVQALVGYCRLIINQWNEGRELSDPAFLYGFEALRPYPQAQYTKPILLLVNMLDFSCGDLLPAILQDNKRATILGTQTAGAGGYVLGHSYPNRLGILGYSFTASIAERVDLNPLENLGVTPDKIVELSEKDLEFGYREFASQIQKAVSDLLK